MIRRGDIYISVDFNGARGSEQTGIRPCIVVSNDLCNKHSPVISVVPVSSQIAKFRLPTHLFLDKYMYSLTSDSLALVEQVTSIDKSRLGARHIKGLSYKDLALLDDMLKIQLGITN